MYVGHETSNRREKSQRGLKRKKVKRIPALFQTTRRTDKTVESSDKGRIKSVSNSFKWPHVALVRLSEFTVEFFSPSCRQIGRQKEKAERTSELCKGMLAANCVIHFPRRFHFPGASKPQFYKSSWISFFFSFRVSAMPIPLKWNNSQPHNQISDCKSMCHHRQPNPPCIIAFTHNFVTQTSTETGMKIVVAILPNSTF